MIESVFVTVGVLLGFWNSICLERTAAAVVRQRRIGMVLGSLALRLALMVLVAWVLLAWSVAAPLLSLLGYWLARTAYIGATVLWRRQIA